MGGYIKIAGILLIFAGLAIFSPGSQQLDFFGMLRGGDFVVTDETAMAAEPAEDATEDATEEEAAEEVEAEASDG